MIKKSNNETSKALETGIGATTLKKEEWLGIVNDYVTPVKYS